jgi:hypothetical protein
VTRTFVPSFRPLGIIPCRPPFFTPLGAPFRSRRDDAFGLADRDDYQAWLNAGAPSMEQRCRERKELLLRTHEVEPAPKALDLALEDVVSAAKKALSGIS